MPGREVNQVCLSVLGCSGDKCMCICFVKESIVLMFKMQCLFLHSERFSSPRFPHSAHQRGWAQ